MRLDIRYVTSFRYAQPVRESQNELRACPANTHRQQLVSYRLTTDPPARVHSSFDHWGTRVDSFGVREPHDHLEIAAEATVETGRQPLLTASPHMAQMADPEFRDLHVEYLTRTPHTDWGQAIADEARQRADAVGDDVISVILALYRTVGTQLTYRPGATYVGVPVDDVLACKEGVCQDFAHLVIAMCRSIGIPARYVSGYLFTADDSIGADVEDDVVYVQTHAWVEAAVPGYGWWALDPTNRQEVGERHVKIGHGRDYDDVLPLRGAFSGPPQHELHVGVEMRRVAVQQQPAPQPLAQQQQYTSRPLAQQQQVQQQQVQQQQVQQQQVQQRPATAGTPT